MTHKQSGEERPGLPNKTGYPAIYEIRIEGMLDPAWSEWLPGMRIFFEHAESGAAETVLRGSVPDQPGLRGILCKLWNLGATVVLVKKQQCEKEERSGAS